MEFTINNNNVMYTQTKKIKFEPELEISFSSQSPHSVNLQSTYIACSTGEISLHDMQ